jgi:quercetin dioxygenase-like cupin family protein
MLSMISAGQFGKGATSGRRWKLIFAGVAIACAFSGVALRLAWATNGAGTGSATVAGPVLFEELDIKGEADADEIELKTKGLWTGRILHFHMAPDGHTGWHSHPGPVFVMISKGEMTLEQSDGSSAVYPAGTGFVEEPDRVHKASNEGDVELEFDAFIVIPVGAPVRIDQPAPSP